MSPSSSLEKPVLNQDQGGPPQWIFPAPPGAWFHLLLPYCWGLGFPALLGSPLPKESAEQVPLLCYGEAISTTGLCLLPRTCPRWHLLLPARSPTWIIIIRVINAYLALATCLHCPRCFPYLTSSFQLKSVRPRAARSLAHGCIAGWCEGSAGATHSWATAGPNMC